MSSNTINKAPPFLELSRDTLQTIDTSGLDFENVLSVWTGLTKCSGFIKNGKRLENMSWRIVNRNLVQSNGNSRVKSHNNTSDNELPRLSSSLSNKLDASDLFSLLSIVTEQNIISQQRPGLTKRKSSNRVLSRKSNRSTESLDKRPGFFRKTSSSKSLKKLNSGGGSGGINTAAAKKRLSTESLSINDADVYEQPNPRYAFGIMDDAQSSSLVQETQESAKPSLMRQDTSTSIIRGFDPNEREIHDRPSPASTSTSVSTNNNHNNDNNNNSINKRQSPKASSLFSNSSKNYQQQPQAPSQKSLFASPPTLSNSDHVKSPLSQETTAQIKNPSRSKSSERKATSLFSHDKQPSQQQQQQHHKSLFDQVGISPDLKKISQSPSPINQQHLQSPPLQPQHTQKPKRGNVLNNLGMTPLSSAKPQKKEKNNMFFIEASPSPTESSVRYIDEQVQEGQQELQNHRHHHHHHSHIKKDETTRSSSSTNSKSPPPQKNTSLFHGKQPVREIIFTSSESNLSDESDDWSSVSEDMASDDEKSAHELNKAWERSVFQRDENKAKKSQVKRSLLSGLFLNEMHDVKDSKDSDHSNNNHHLFQKPAMTTSSSRSSSHSRQVIRQNGSHSNIDDKDHELSTSVSSSNYHIKHHGQKTDPLQLSTIEPHTVISTSNVNVPGLVNEPHTEESKTLRAKLESSQNDAQPSSSFSQMISKSAMNLTNYFATHRKNSFSSIASDRTKTRFHKHESNAPPTASTLLPTALSTHMFLPNAHQRARRSKLASLVESDTGTTSSADNSRKNSTTEESAKTSTVPIRKQSFKVELNKDDKPIIESQINKNFHTAKFKDDETNNISRKLSPKTTRNQMLATELSDSLRKSILWDRQSGLYPGSKSNGQKKSFTVDPKQKKGKTDEDVNEAIDLKDDDGNDGDDEGDVEVGEQKRRPRVLRTAVEQMNDDDWEHESFYARGW